MAGDGTQVGTFPISGGMQDDVPDFIQETPSLAYIENGRFRKANEVEKRLPFTRLDEPNSPAGDPVLLTTQGDSLVSLSDQGELYTLGAADENWQTVRDTRILPTDVSVEFQTPTSPGMFLFQAGETNAASLNPHRLIAWEERRLGTDVSDEDLVASDVVVEARTTSGALIVRTRLTDCRAPKIRRVGLYSTPYLFYVDDTGDIHSCRLSGASLSTASLSIGTELEHPDIAALITNYGTAIAGRDDMRIGFSNDGGNGSVWDINYAPLSDVGVLIYKDTSTGTGRVRAIVMDAYATSGTAWTIATDATTFVYTPLACALNDAGTVLGVLYSGLDSSNADGDLTFETWTISTKTQTESFATAGGLSLRAVNASLVYDSVSTGPDKWRYVYTEASQLPEDYRYEDYGDIPYVRAGTIDTGTNLFDEEQRYSNCRLVTEAVLLTDGTGTARGDLVFGIEQWLPGIQPWRNGYVQEFASSPTLTKPVTTVIVAVEYASDNTGKVLAALGAGQNKGYNASSSEQSTMLNGAYLANGDEPHFCVRNIFQPEDLSIYLSDRATGRTKYRVLLVGEAAGRVVKVAPTESVRARSYGDVAYLAMGVPCVFDGVTLGEAAVLDQPEVTYVNAHGTGGRLQPTTWSYEVRSGLSTTDVVTVQVVLGYADRFGQLHRSAPSIPVWVTGLDPATVGATRPQLEVGFTNPVSVYGEDNDYFAEVFIGLDAGVPKLAHTQRVDVSNTWATNAVIVFNALQYTPTTGMVEPIRYSEILYTEGNVLPSDPWPSFKDFVVTSNRMFAISAELPGTIYYSKLFEPNIAPEFSAALVLDLGRNRALTGIGSIDDKVVVFTDREIFAIYDTGPDNTGANGDFVVDRLLATNGCTDPQSLVETDDGLFFYSNITKQFHLLTRDLQIADVGKAIQDSAGDIANVTSGVVFPSEHEVRWYVTNGAQLEYGATPDTGTGIPARPPRPRYQNTLPTNAVIVYNYQYKKWCVHSLDPKAAHSTLWNGQVAYIVDTNWRTYITDPTAWGEDTANLLKLRMPPIRIASLQSYGRIDEIAFLGKYLSDWADNGSGLESGDVQVTLTYDYEGYGATTDVYRFRANRGDLGTSRMQFSAHPGRPKCQAVQIEIEEIPTTKVEVSEPTYTSGRGFALSGLDVISKQKRGLGTKSTPQETSK